MDVLTKTADQLNGHSKSFSVEEQFEQDEKCQDEEIFTNGASSDDEISMLDITGRTLDISGRSSDDDDGCAKPEHVDFTAETQEILNENEEPSSSESSNANFSFVANLFDNCAPKCDQKVAEHVDDSAPGCSTSFDTPGFVETCPDSAGGMVPDVQCSIVSRHARRRTSMFGRSYKDLLQRGLQVDGTDTVTSCAEKFLSGLETCRNSPEKVKKKRKKDRKEQKIGKHSPKAVDKVGSGRSRPKQEEEETFWTKSRKEEDLLKFFALNQNGRRSSEEMKIDNEEEEEVAREICLVCGENAQEGNNSNTKRGRSGSSLVLCSLCAEPYDKWRQEPWKYSTFQCAEKLQGLICMPYSRLDCVACWFWQCVNIVRGQHLKKWSAKFRPPRRELDLIESNIDGEGSTSQECPIQVDSNISKPSSSTENAGPSAKAECTDQDGPRVRYVCRRSSVLTGIFDPNDEYSSNDRFNNGRFILSALPKNVKRALVGERYKAISSRRNKLVIKIKRQHSSTNDSAQTSERPSGEWREPANQMIGEGKSSKKRQRCGVCVGCLAKNCGVCPNCRDMPRNGGAGILKSACRERTCLYLAAHRDNSKCKKRACIIKPIGEIEPANQEAVEPADQEEVEFEDQEEVESADQEEFKFADYVEGKSADQEEGEPADQKEGEPLDQEEVEPADQAHEQSMEVDDALTT